MVTANSSHRYVRESRFAACANFSSGLDYERWSLENPLILGHEYSSRKVFRELHL
jgi:hypothetical protein